MKEDVSRKTLVLGAIQKQKDYYIKLLNDEAAVGEKCNLCKYLKDLTDPLCLVCPWNLFAEDFERETAEFLCEEILSKEEDIETFFTLREMLFDEDIKYSDKAKEIINKRIATLKDWAERLEDKDEMFFYI